MNASYTYIVKPSHIAAQNLCGYSSFLRYPHIAGAAGGYHDGAPAGNLLGQYYRQAGQWFIV